ncbi:MAG: response regulator transcription factor [Kordiimonadaceae bacterium]|nr:response regulator transcription factor [Kordiimonadaceae bacterium]
MEKQLIMPNLILIVDDDDEIRDVVSTLLELNGFNFIEAVNAEEMYQKIEYHDVSLILLDIGLPKNDGFTALKKIRKNYDIPVVLLTGKGDVIDKVVGLELGADDYITKPFHSHELIARLKTVLRRSQIKQPTETIVTYEQSLISFNGWQLDVNAQILINPNSEEIKVTGHEFAILHALIKSAGRTLTRGQLLDHVDGNSNDHSPYDRSLDVMIAKLRKKLGDNSKMPKFIRTVRQTGYMFIAKIVNP